MAESIGGTTENSIGHIKTTPEKPVSSVIMGGQNKLTGLPPATPEPGGEQKNQGETRLQIGKVTNPDGSVLSIDYVGPKTDFLNDPATSVDHDKVEINLGEKRISALKKLDREEGLMIAEAFAEPFSSQDELDEGPQDGEKGDDKTDKKKKDLDRRKRTARIAAVVSLATSLAACANAGGIGGQLKDTAINASERAVKYGVIDPAVRGAKNEIDTQEKIEDIQGQFGLNLRNQDRRTQVYAARAYSSWKQSQGILLIKYELEKADLKDKRDFGKIKTNQEYQDKLDAIKLAERHDLRGVSGRFYSTLLSIAGNDADLKAEIIASQERYIDTAQVRGEQRGRHIANQGTEVIIEQAGQAAKGTVEILGDVFK